MAGLIQLAKTCHCHSRRKFQKRKSDRKDELLMVLVGDRVGDGQEASGNKAGGRSYQSRRSDPQAGIWLAVKINSLWLCPYLMETQPMRTMQRGTKADAT